MKAWECDVTVARVGACIMLDGRLTPVGSDLYGVRFHNSWRKTDHCTRQVYRWIHGKAESWMPPGYPSIWD